jgi:hypothetical protein
MREEIPRLFVDESLRKMLDECIQKDYFINILVTCPSKEQRNTLLYEAISAYSTCYEIKSSWLSSLKDIERFSSLRLGLVGKREFLIYKDLDEALKKACEDEDILLFRRFYNRLNLIRLYCVAFFATASSMQDIMEPLRYIFNYELRICPKCGDVTTYRIRRFTSCSFDKTFEEVKK